MKTKLIINPHAKNSKIQKHIQLIHHYFKRNEIEYDYESSQYVGHITEIAQEAIQSGYERLVIAGGDGSLNELVNGVIKADGDPQIGVIPVGTCNDFAKVLGLPHDVEQACEIALNGSPQKYDVGKFSDRFFINAAGFGFDVEILKTMKKSKTTNNFVKYLSTVFRHILGYKARPVDVDSEQFKSSLKSLLFVVANGVQFGGQFKISPNSLPNDGLLDVVVIKDLHPIKRFGILANVLKAKHLDLEQVEYFRTKNLTLTSNTSFDYQVEGELCNSSTGNIDISVLEKRLKILSPREV